MKYLLTIAACSVGALSVVVQACASAEPEETTAPSPAPATILDGGGTVDADIPDRTPPPFPQPETCSAAGWCVVPPPAYGSYVFQFELIWPVTGHAFAAGRSVAPDGSNIPSTVQEWDYRTKTWTRIDNDFAPTGQGGIHSLWAPNADEVYYSTFQFGVIGAEMHHGRRPSPPETVWSWTTQKLDCNVRFAPEVWGSGPDDVRAVGCKKIFRHSADVGDGGTETWIEEVVETDASLDFSGITGTGPEDVWIYGRKANCPYVLRKTSGTFAPIAEGAFAGGKCVPKGELITFDQYLYFNGPPVFTPSPGELVVIRTDGQQIARIRESTSGAYGVEFASPLPTVPALGLLQGWSDGDGSLWFLTSDANILHATDVWSDAGAKLEYSTLVRNGAPNDAMLKNLRGPSTDNLWASGDKRAFYKSTP